MGVAILIAVAAVVIALASGRSALLAGSASEARQEALKLEFARGTAVFGATLPIYVLAAPVAQELVRASQRAEAYGRILGKAPASARDSLRVERDAQAQLAAALVLQLAGQRLDARDDDVPSALARRRADALAGRPDPVVREREGDALGDESALLLASVLPAALAVLLATLAEVHSRRRPLVIAGWALVAAAIAAALVQIAV